jgi:lipid-A-disaccharide synthase
MNKTGLRIGIIAGEVSGDFLGANLIQAIQQYYPIAQVEGIAGPQLIAAGTKALVPMEKISLFGIAEIITKIPSLFMMRRKLIAHFLANPPDIFIGIDSPDFTLGVEIALKKAGIPTVHYVSPSVWAWRQWRCHKIARAVDLMLTLLPFEKAVYDKYNIAATFVGHPLADRIPLQNDKFAAREALALPENQNIIALLPGSRASELNRLSDLFINTALWCLQQMPALHFVVALATPTCRRIFTESLSRLAPQLPITLIDGKASQVMSAADSVLLASGTAALECALVKRPMVVSYRVNLLTYWIVNALIKVDYVALPNLLVNKLLVPEFLQADATVANLGPAVLKSLQDPSYSESLQQDFLKIHQSLYANHGKNAALAVLDLLTKKGVIHDRRIAETSLVAD